MKKLSIVLSIILLCSSFGITSYAENENDLLKKADSYGFKEAEELPEGVVPIEVNSIEELDKVMESLNSMEKDFENSNLETSYKINPKTSLSRSNNIYIDTVSLSNKFRPVANTKLTLSCTYEYYAKGSFYGIERARDHGWSLYGNTRNVSLSNSRSSANAKNGVLTVSGRTQVDYYILIKGTIRYYSNVADANFKYSLEKGMFSKNFNWQK